MTRRVYPDQILDRLNLPKEIAQELDEGKLDIPIPLTAEWRQFLATHGDGEVPAIGSRMQVGGRLAITVALETLLGVPISTVAPAPRYVKYTWNQIFTTEETQPSVRCVRLHADGNELRNIRITGGVQVNLGTGTDHFVTPWLIGVSPDASTGWSDGDDYTPLGWDLASGSPRASGAVCYINSALNEIQNTVAAGASGVIVPDGAAFISPTFVRLAAEPASGEGTTRYLHMAYDALIAARIPEGTSIYMGLCGQAVGAVYGSAYRQATVLEWEEAV